MMQYFIVLKILRLQVAEFLYYFTYFSLLVQKPNKTPKPNKTQKTHWVGFFLKRNPGFLNPGDTTLCLCTLTLNKIGIVSRHICHYFYRVNIFLTTLDFFLRTNPLISGHLGTSFKFQERREEYGGPAAVTNAKDRTVRQWTLHCHTGRRDVMCQPAPESFTSAAVTNSKSASSGSGSSMSAF